ncbi:MAG: divalent cation transporter [Crenarchaeota archaeon]|nr:divalent cation transporter [Thermoproteota archaeon]MDA1125309.1 divalent cation transporter [Thermoproteota archaeon]
MTSSKPVLAISAIAPIVLLIIMIAFLLGPASSFLQFGIVLPEVSIEKIEFTGNEIKATVRNTGPINVNIVLADVNDRIQPAAVEPDTSLERFETALVRIPFDWNEGQPYEIGVTINDGTRFAKEVDAAFPSLEPDVDLFVFLGMIGFLIGVVPIMIGLLWYPFIKKLGKNSFNFFLAFAMGLLIFLGIDAVIEATKISKNHLSSVFNGELLIATVIILSFLALYGVGKKLTRNPEFSKLSKGLAISLMIAIGIGFHNLGEGLAVGAAIALGEVAFSTFLIVGFATHNTTEGLAIAAPLTSTKTKIVKMAGLGLIAGVPAIFGTWIGGFSFSPFFTIIFLAIGVGAIFQVVLSIFHFMNEKSDLLSNTSLFGGISTGLFVMYLTSILI